MKSKKKDKTKAGAKKDKRNKQTLRDLDAGTQTGKVKGGRKFLIQEM